MLKFCKSEFGFLFGVAAICDPIFIYLFCYKWSELCAIMHMMYQQGQKSGILMGLKWIEVYF